MRHHYSVTSQGLPEDREQWFHTFEEAESGFSALIGAAEEGGRQVASESYWRRELEGGAGPVRLALDDVGLAPCAPACGLRPD